MRPMGIVRRMDELGRVVIPKEIRRTLHLKEGEQLEMFAQDEGLFLKKYSVVQAVRQDAVDYCRVVQSLVGGDVAVSDAHEVVGGGFAHGVEPHGALLHPAVSAVMARRNIAWLSGIAPWRGAKEYRCTAVCPLVARGDLYGAFLWGTDEAVDGRMKGVVETACALFSHHIEN